LTYQLIFYYIYWSARLNIKPWRYFQINAEWYNPQKHLYSKIDIDAFILPKWRLNQVYFDTKQPPKTFPVFIKPEWGQNSNGIVKINNLTEFLAFKTNNKVNYIVQAAALEQQEYEIFYIRDALNNKKLAVLSITQSLNTSNERFPINGIFNKDMCYQDLTSDFSTSELAKIHAHLGQLPNFRIARVGLKSNSKADLLNGKFHIIEINLFAPFPINLLDNKTTKKSKMAFIKNSMYHLACVSDTVPKQHFHTWVFLRKIIKHYQTRG
jgi:hypothetical protein